ncbi:cupin domain-containing protein [Fulvivirgaceae bacterium BMA10]|uniref:Cupin domain-containing protein n=1 Tax=Splendidivirga corallicola TaxID=3051826 RepID=A0ABT8KUC9_9BACT|nr:cupin domain-containing protein [Fulvivirgaceae bacterium BMA10]
MPLYNLDNIAEKELLPGFFAKLIHGENLTTAHFRVTQGAELPEHAHHHEQISRVLSGRFQLTVGDHTEVMEPGKVYVIPSNVPHSGKALSDCIIMDVFSPAREDYK